MVGGVVQVIPVGRRLDKEGVSLLVCAAAWTYVANNPGRQLTQGQPFCSHKTRLWTYLRTHLPDSVEQHLAEAFEHLHGTRPPQQQTRTTPCHGTTLTLTSSQPCGSGCCWRLSSATFWCQATQAATPVTMATAARGAATVPVA